MVNVRIARPADAATVLEIYSIYIRSSAASFETELPSLEEFSSRMEKYLQKFPWIVCQINNDITGYVYASTHREREAYQWTCESSVYVRQNFQGLGLGMELYKTLFQILKRQGLVNVYAGITLPNDASIRLHEKLGFEQFALYNKVGYKLHSWHDVGWWKLRLNEYNPKPSPPVWFSDLDPMLFESLLKQATINIQRNGGFS